MFKKSLQNIKKYKKYKKIYKKSCKNIKSIELEVSPAIEIVILANFRKCPKSDGKNIKTTKRTKSAISEIGQM